MILLAEPYVSDSNGGYPTTKAPQQDEIPTTRNPSRKKPLRQFHPGAAENAPYVATVPI